VAPLLKRVGANFSADKPVADLSLAQQQMVEIAKALSIKARLVPAPDQPFELYRDRDRYWLTTSAP